VSTLKDRLHEIVFEADTRKGKIFDIFLLIAILFSVIIVMLDSVPSIVAENQRIFYTLEWVFTILFSIEYLMRLWITRKPWKYALSFYGVVDLLSVLPTYIALIVTGPQYLMIIRVLRLMRIFRVLKIARYVSEFNNLKSAMKRSRAKIIVFLVFIFGTVMILGTVMYLIEGAQNGFTSIPRSVYWAVVTLTTVGYGDIAPQTALGQFIASVIMIMGYGIIAVPTGIVTAELVRTEDVHLNTQACPSCSKEGHEDDAVHCKFCGEPLRTN
jgi:voltage-gated potassium channel